MLESTWARSQRPAELQSRSVVNSMSWEALLAMSKIARMAEKDNKGELVEKFSRDKKPPSTKYREASDNRYDVLHGASFERLCIREFPKWWHKAPTSRSHIYRSIPLEFVGCQNTISDKTVTNMHDRKNVLALKNFMAENVSVAAKPRVTYTAPDGSSSADLAWVVPTTMAQVQDAIATYGLVLHAIWPFDPTALVINKALTKYRWFSVIDKPATRVAAVTKFFDHVMRVNADRATNRKCIMSCREMIEAAGSILTNSGFSAAFPFDNVGNGGGGGGANQRKDKDKPKKPTRPEYNGKGLCFAFNSVEGGVCKNGIPNTDQCKDDKGRIFIHRCSYHLGKGVYCKEKHKRKDHK